MGLIFQIILLSLRKPEKAISRYSQNGEVRDYPLEIQHKDGHITPVLYNASVYRNENDEVIGVFAAARDITELKKAEEKIQDTGKCCGIIRRCNYN